MVSATLQFVRRYRFLCVATLPLFIRHELSNLTPKEQRKTEVIFDRRLKASTDDVAGDHSASGAWLAASAVPPKPAVIGSSSLRMGMANEPRLSRQNSAPVEGLLGMQPPEWLSAEAGASILAAISGKGSSATPDGVASSGKARAPRAKEKARPRLPTPSSPPSSEVESWSKQMMNEEETEDFQRGEGYIIGAAYSGPEFHPHQPVQFEDPPIFAMENVSLSPILRTRKPINQALAQLTSLLRKNAVDYCAAQQLNCNEEHALQTAISVSIRTSPVASMLRQISASLSAVEGAVSSAFRPLGWPADPRAPDAPKPPAKPPLLTTSAVQFGFSLVETAVALLRSLIVVTKGRQTVPPPLGTITSQQPQNIDGHYTLASMTGEALVFERQASQGSNQPLGPPGRLYMYKPTAGDNHGETVQNALVAFSPQTGGGDTEGPLAYLPASALNDPSYQQHAPAQCRTAKEFTFPYCLLKGLTRWRFTNVRDGAPDPGARFFPAAISVRKRYIWSERICLYAMLSVQREMPTMTRAPYTLE
ncbi:hypothetical protein Emed_000963 [Eimeria media]